MPIIFGVITAAAVVLGWFTITMKPGKYSLLCNLPGHFANGMYADFTVN